MDTAEIDLRRYLEIVWKWRLVIVLLTLAAVAASAIFSFFVLSPVYETRVTLLVTNAAQNQQSVRPAGDTSVAETVSRIPSMTLNTYMSQLTSPYFLNRVVAKLGLPNVAPNSLTSMVSAQVLKDTSLIEVRVQNTDKGLAAKIANTMASEFVQFVSETNQERMSKSLAFLAEQEAMLKKELAAAYSELSRIQTRPDSYTATSREIAAKSQLIVSFSETLVKIKAKIEELKASVRDIETHLKATAEFTVEPANGNAGTPNTMYRQRQEELTAAKRQLSTVEAEQAAFQEEKGRLESSIVVLETRLMAVRNSEALVQADVARLVSTLNLLSSKMVEAQMAHSLNLGETTISVVSPALEPVSPVKPRKMVNMAVAGVLGAFVSILLVFVLDYMDNTLKTPDDVMTYLDLGTLGVIPQVENRQRRRK